MSFRNKNLLLVEFKTQKQIDCTVQSVWPAQALEEPRWLRIQEFSTAKADKGWFCQVQDNMQLISKPGSCPHRESMSALQSIYTITVLRIMRKTDLLGSNSSFSISFFVRVEAWMALTSGRPSAKGRTPLGGRSSTTSTLCTGPSSNKQPGTWSRKVRHKEVDHSL